MARPEPVPLTLYSKPDCPLCDELKEELARARVRTPYTVTEVNIEGDPELEAAYGLSIPVLVIAGKTAFKGRMTRADFERKFERLAAGFHAAGGRNEVP